MRPTASFTACDSLNAWWPHSWACGWAQQLALSGLLHEKSNFLAAWALQSPPDQHWGM